MNDKNKKLFFVGGFQSYSFQNLKECFFFSQGHPTKNKLFAKFEDYGPGPSDGGYRSSDVSAGIKSFPSKMNDMDDDEPF